MPLFDRRLIAPTDAELLEALQGAERMAGGRAAERHGRPRREQVARESLRQAEGARELGDGTWALFRVAWWTDHLGRRHYRLVTGRPGGGDDGLQFRTLDGTRPPLWYVYPAQVFCRTQEGRAEWLTACACGACGPPSALAWMGTCCGPCHDRAEEGVAPLPPPRFDGPREPVHALTFTPDGQHLVTATGGRLHLYDVLSGAGEILEPPRSGGGAFTALAASVGGDLAVGSGAGEVLTFDAQANRWRRVGIFVGPVGGLEFSPQGAALTATAGDTEAGLWWRGPAGGWEHGNRPKAGTALAFAPEGDVLALGQPGGWVSLLVADSGAVLRTFGTGAKVGHDVRLMAFSPDGHLLFSLSGPYTGRENFRGLLQAWDLGGRELGGYRAELPPLSLAAFSPDRQWLAWVAYDQQSSPAAVTFWDVRARRVRAALEWNPDDAVYCLAFSPDGRLLATGGQSGTIKLWPWRELLEA